MGSAVQPPFGSLAGPRAGMKGVPRPLLQPQAAELRGSAASTRGAVKRGWACDGGQELVELWAQGLDG